MIIDNIKNAEKYFGLSEGIKKALLFIKEKDFESLEEGKHEINGSEIFFMINRYETKAPEIGSWEAHKKYIDVQFVADGVEKMGYAPVENLTVTQDYNDEKDIMRFSGSGDFVTAGKGTFAIFFPGDGHMPGMNAEGTSQKILKIVVKVSAE